MKTLVFILSAIAVGLTAALLVKSLSAPVPRPSNSAPAILVLASLIILLLARWSGIKPKTVILFLVAVGCGLVSAGCVKYVY